MERADKTYYVDADEKIVSKADDAAYLLCAKGVVIQPWIRKKYDVKGKGDGTASIAMKKAKKAAKKKAAEPSENK